MDSELLKVIPKESIFVSYRSPKNIKSLLINSKLRTDDATEPTQHGCFKCNKCYLCRRYLQETRTFTSHHTQQTFNIKQNITCNNKNVIYLIECSTHECSYVGYTTNSMKMRFSNNKSHIKKKKHSCEICTHMIMENHDLDFSTTARYDETMSHHIKVTLIEEVKGINEGESTQDKERKCERREAFWQRQLRTLTTYGGLNVRDGGRNYLNS